jgi:hypothetical protein
MGAEFVRVNSEICRARHAYRVPGSGNCEQSVCGPVLVHSSSSGNSYGLIR